MVLSARRGNVDVALLGTVAGLRGQGSIARALFRAGAALEIGWGKHIIQGGFLGATDEIMENFIKGRCNHCSRGLGLGDVFTGVKDSVPWFDQFSKPNGGRSNFFESKPTDYDASGLEW